MAALTLLGLAAGLLAAAGGPVARAQVGTGWRLYGLDNGRRGILEIDTATGRARFVGSAGFATSASAMASARGTVPGPGGRSFPPGTFFGLLGDGGDGRDYVTVADPTTGSIEKLVATSRDVGGRGIAFGPDGVTLYLLETSGELSTVDTVTGQVRWLATVRDGSGQVYSSTSLEFESERRSFLAIGSGGKGSELIQISPLTGRAVVLGSLGGLSACTLVQAPAEIPGPGGSRLPAGTWLTIDTAKGDLLVLDIDLSARTAGRGPTIGPLGSASSGSVCGAAFAAPVAPPPSPTPPPTASPSPRPPASPSPTAAPACVCREVLARVPPAIISEALANPEIYHGWRLPLDPNKPPGPANPPRECLTLIDRNVPYHRLWNGPTWRVGCP